MRLAIIIPTLNEAAVIDAALARLAPLRARGVRVIVADGGSSDDTVMRALNGGADAVVPAARGRGRQMNAGARHPLAAESDVLLFLHADTALPPDGDRLVLRTLANAPNVWGRFDVQIEGRPMLRVIAGMMNWRSRATGISTGDQAIFVLRSAFVALDGFAPIPLMEDIDFSRRARLLSRPLALHEKAVTSGRRWERDGVWRTVLLMWRLRLAYAFGADPNELAQKYRSTR